MLAPYHHTVQSKVLQQGQAVRTQSVSGFFQFQGIKGKLCC